MFDPVGVFERSFTPVEGGYLYYPSRWSGGYLVTPAEYRHLVAEWRRVAGWRGILKGIGLLLLGMLIGTPILLLAGADAWASDALMYVLAGSLVIYVLWKGTAPHRLIRGRKAIAPSRSSKEFEVAMGKALGRPIAAYLAFLSLCFLAWALGFAYTSPAWGIPLSIVVAILAFLNIRMAARAFYTKR